MWWMNQMTNGTHTYHICECKIEQRGLSREKKRRRRCRRRNKHEWINPKTQANRIENIMGRKVYHDHRAPIDSVNTLHYALYATSVCYTVRLYSYKLLKCSMPFRLNKHLWIGQTHSQTDAAMLRNNKNNNNNNHTLMTTMTKEIEI